MRATCRLIGLCLILGLAAHPALGDDLRDLFFGEALYHAHQGQYFEAIQRLDTELAQYYRLDEPALDTLHYHINDAEFSVGDFELDYRMHYRAGRAIKRVLEGSVDDAVRNEAAFRLARIHFQKDQLDDALQALGRIRGSVPEQIKDDVEFLRANIYMATGRPNEAVEVLSHLQNDKSLAGFVAYNLGMALLRAGRPKEAIEQLDKAGQLPAGDPAGLAIRDKSNLVLGSLLFESGNLERAKQSLDRVRLEGPFSNQALLRAGWAEASAHNYDRALVPWNILANREPTDVAVQEAMLAAPHAYASLKLYGRSALMYGRALELFSNQIEKVDASIDSVKQGRFLKALIREESREDQTWVIRLRKQNYEPLLPVVDAQFQELNSRMRLRLEQRKHLAERLQTMLTAPRPDYLATTDERTAGERIALIEKQIGNSDSAESLALRQRAARLQGVLTWRLETEYQERLTAAYEHLNELNTQVDALTRQYEAFVRARQAATHSYVGYDAQIAQLRERARRALERVDTLMARQGHMIETVATNQLQARRERLVAQQTQARYGVADSYDRTARVQSGAEGR